MSWRRVAGSETTHALDEVSLNLQEGLAFLKIVASDVEREVVGVDQESYPVQVLGQVALAEVGGDEDSANEQPERFERDVVLRVEVVGHGGGNVNKRAERGRPCVSLAEKSKDQLTVPSQAQKRNAP